MANSLILNPETFEYKDISNEQLDKKTGLPYTTQ